MRLCALTAFAAAMIASCGPAFSAEAPIPDFYRGGVGWTLLDGKNFLPPPPGTPGAAGPIGNHPDYPSFGNQSGQLPTKRIGNDTHPFLLPWAAQQMRELRKRLAAGDVPFDPSERCWPPGVPSAMKMHRPSNAVFEESICVEGAADRFNVGLRPPAMAEKADF